jgi:serine protease Do
MSQDAAMTLPFRCLPFLLFGSWLVAGVQEPEPKPDAVAVLSAIDDEALLQRIEAECEVLRVAGKLRPFAELAAAAARRDAPGDPPRPRTAASSALAASSPLAAVAAHALLARSVCMVGEHYPCDECQGWHFSASTGFSLGDGLVATCLHVLQPRPDEPGGLVAAAGPDGKAYAVTELVAFDELHDLAVVRCPGLQLPPLPLGDEAGVGARVFCLSHPDHRFFTFSEGMVSRRYMVRGPAPGCGEAEAGPDAEQPPEAAAHDGVRADAAARVFLQVTCAFAGGSSGAPILDARGFVVGIAQSTATIQAPGEDGVEDPQMVVRTAIPAAALLALLRR